MIFSGISYKARRRWKNFFIAATAVAALLVVIWLLWMLWLNRYVIYTRDGVLIDFSRSVADLSGQEARPPVPGETVAIHYVDSAEFKEDTSDELTQIIILDFF